jgi:amino acid adenylation domain-containing protein
MDPDDLVYRTGDLGRILDDGAFEFLGRKDSQVKIRGVRVELGEIEGVLREHEAVADAAAAIYEDRTGETQLFACVVLMKPWDLRQIEEFASDRLASYMVPRVSEIEQLPVLETGKVDRSALPQPGCLSRNSTSVFVAPRTSIETILVGIWERVLGVADISIDDEYFSLGGNSLQAARLIAEVNVTFKVNIPLTKLLENRTVSKLARVINEAVSSELEAIELPRFAADIENRHAPFPLTDIQQAYWVGRTGAVELGDVATHTYIEFEARHLDCRLFCKTWQRLIERHDMLCAIVLPDGQQQVLRKVPEYQPRQLRLIGKTPEEIEHEINDIRAEMSHQILPSDRWPLFDFRLTVIDETRTRIHISYDMLIIDAFSNAILAREFAHYYYHPDQALEPINISFRDCVVHELRMKETPLFEWSRAYWMQRIEELPPAPELPLQKNVDRLESQRFSHRSYRIKKESWKRLNQFVAKSGMTSSGLLIAVLAEVLSCWSKNQHFCINVTLFNRPAVHPEVNQIVGDFTTVTLLEVDHRNKDTFRVRAERLQRQLWQDLDHRYFSGVQVIREVTRRLGGTRRALYPVVFTSTLVHGGMREGTSTLLKDAQTVYRSSQTSQVWLDNVVIEEDETALVRWNVVEDLFPDGMVADMFQAYCDLLDRLANNGETWDERVQILPAAQRGRREENNRTAVSFPRSLLHECFAARAHAHPERNALVSATRRLTYGEMHRLSATLARRLRDAGATANMLIPIVMEKGWEQIVAVLGILKAGAAYLPIDIAVPKDRLWYILENAQANIALTQSHVDSKTEWPCGIQRVCVDQLETHGEAVEIDRLQTPSSLAYVIYTSGSTGTPKGVMITHEGVLNRVLDVNSRFSVGEDDRLIALTALHHDLSVYDIFGALCAGGTIVMPEAEQLRDPNHWLDLIATEGVTIWNSVPAYMEMLVEALEGEKESAAVRVSSLRLAFLSGDWIPVSLPGRIRVHGPQLKIVSLGGPTEIAVWDVCYPIATIGADWKSIPYGKPMANHRLYIMDETLEERPDWVPGEIYSSGTGVTPGYWRDEEKTKERFISHPITGERLFRTGDLGRYLPDGNIEFLGRSDSQVKIQGLRIELSEIEATLARHPDVKGAAVALLGSGTIRKLEAFIILRESVQATASGAKASDLKSDPLDRLRFKMGKPSIRKGAQLACIDLLRSKEDESLMEQFVKRRSYRSFQKEPILFAAFSELLNPLMQIQFKDLPLPKSRYASAGGLYPVQVYFYIKPSRVNGLHAGAYYYNPVTHQLELLSEEVAISPNEYHQPNRAIFKSAAFSLFFVAEMSAIEPIYGDKARDFCMIEAGLMTHLLESEAAEHGIGLCHIGGVDFEHCAPHFGLGDSHMYLHGLVGGAIAPRQRTLRGLVDESVEIAEAIATIGRPDVVPHDYLSNSDSRYGLREYLRTKLPEYMVPTSYHFVDKIPLSANGKVNRQKLADLREIKPPVDEVLQGSARSEIEQEIADIWALVLGLEKVGVLDNFFDLGGNSVQLIRVHLRLKERFAGDFSVIDMFSHPTVRDLSRLVSGHSRESPGLDDIAERARLQRSSGEKGRRSKLKPGDRLNE